MPTWLGREVRAEKESVHKKAEADSASDCNRISSCSSCNTEEVTLTALRYLEKLTSEHKLADVANLFGQGVSSGLRPTDIDKN